jgi:hypothetical protein
MSFQGSLLARFFLVPCQKLDADLITGHSNQLASAIREAGRRQKQEEFLEIQSFDGVFDAQPRPGLRDVYHPATAAPRPVDSHDENVDAALEIDAFVLPHPEGHEVLLRCLNRRNRRLLSVPPRWPLRSGKTPNDRCAVVSKKSTLRDPVTAVPHL